MCVKARSPFSHPQQQILWEEGLSGSEEGLAEQRTFRCQAPEDRSCPLYTKDNPCGIIRSNRLRSRWLLSTDLYQYDERYSQMEDPSAPLRALWKQMGVKGAPKMRLGGGRRGGWGLGL